MEKNKFLRKDYMVYKPKYFLYCTDCKAGISVKDKLKEFEFEDDN